MDLTFSCHKDTVWSVSFQEMLIWAMKEREVSICGGKHGGESPFAFGTEMDHPAAVLPAREAGIEKMGKQRPPERAGEMRAPLAPVEAGPANGSPEGLQHVDVDTMTGDHLLSGLCQLRMLFVACDCAGCTQAVEHANAIVPGKVIVADPCLAQRRFLRSRPVPEVTAACGKSHQAFDQGSNAGIGEGEIAVATLLALADQAAFFKLGEVRACGLQRDSGCTGKLRRRQRATSHE